MALEDEAASSWARSEPEDHLLSGGTVGWAASTARREPTLYTGSMGRLECSYHLAVAYLVKDAGMSAMREPLTTQGPKSTLKCASAMPFPSVFSFRRPIVNRCLCFARCPIYVTLGARL